LLRRRGSGGESRDVLASVYPQGIGVLQRRNEVKTTLKKRKLATALLTGALAMAALPALAADAVTLQLKWVAQAQFGGYYAALEKGFYDEEGLDVTIKPGGPDIAPEQVIAGGGADVIVDWMAGALAARDK